MDSQAQDPWENFKKKLETGHLRAAEKVNGEWVVNIEVKKNILKAFRDGKLKNYPHGFVDKENFPPREFNTQDNVRLVPGGSAVRAGSFIGQQVVIMPPSYVNVGAYVDSGTMIDSHVLVGSCAQVGKNVHLSAGVQIGGVLEPVGQTPVIIEDNSFIGAGCIIVEGVKILAGAVLAPGVVLSRAIPVYDLVYEKKLPLGASIPSQAVVVPGTRAHQSSWAQEHGLHMNCALIVKYKDEKTSAALELEKLLR